MRVLVTGVCGQLGYDVMKALKQTGHEGLGFDKSTMDLTKKEEIHQTILTTCPEAIIHCGAYTAVDQAEEEQELCFKINAEATKEIALCAKILNIPIIYISTDYVFDGEKVEPYTEEDEPNPLNVYGASKLKGEQYIQSLLDNYYIVRISWVFGENGSNFVKKMLKLGKINDSLAIIHDQIGSPTYTKDLAPLLVHMLEVEKYGIYHVTNEGDCSWYEFACQIFKLSGIQVKLQKVSSDNYQTKAKRPLNSRLSKRKLREAGFSPLPVWSESLKEYLKVL